MDDADRSAIEFRLVDPTSDAATGAMAAYFAELHGRFATGFQADDTEADVQEMHAPNGAFVVVFGGDAPLGCGGVRRLDELTGEVKRMWLDSSLRGLGLGRTLLDELESHMIRLGYSTVMLDTNAVLIEAIAMYERAGYESIERYNDNPYAQRWFRKQLA